MSALADPNSLSGYTFSVETSNGAICRFGQSERPILGLSTGSSPSQDLYLGIEISIPLNRDPMDKQWCEELAAQEMERGTLDKVMVLNDLGLLSEAELMYWKQQLLPVPAEVLEAQPLMAETFEEIEDPVSCIGEC